MVHPHTGILFSLKEEGHPDTCHDVEGPRRHCSVRGARPRRTHPAGPQSQEVPRGVPSTQTDRREWEPGLGQGVGSLCFMGTESPCGEMESSGNGGWGWLQDRMSVLN